MRSFLTWVTAVHAMVEEDRHRAAARIQQFVRDRRRPLSTRSWSPPPPRRREEKQAAQPVPVPGDGGGVANGFTTDGKHYFATLYECEQYTAPGKRWATAS